MSVTTLDIHCFETYVAAVAERGIRIEWDSSDSIPRVDGKTMWLPKPNAAWTQETLDNIRHALKHETSHIVDSSFSKLNESGISGLLGFINNCIEDNRVDYRNDKKYRGDVAVSEKFMEGFARKIKEAADKHPELVKAREELAPLMYWDSIERDWLSNTSETARVLASELTEEGKERAAKLLKYGDRLRDLRSIDNKDEAFDAVQKLSEDILKDVYGRDPETMKSKKKAAGESGAEKGKGDKKGQSSLDDDIDRLVNVIYDATGKKEHKPNTSRTGIHMELPVTGSSSYSVPSPDEYLVTDFAAKRYVGIAARESPVFRKKAITETINEVSRPMTNKLRIKLQTRAKDRYEYGVKKGKLHNGSLHRLVTSDGPASERVFRKKVVSNTLDTAVTLLVDCSGSMSGSKFEMACAAAAALSAALRPLHIKHSVLGFTNSYDLDSKEPPIIFKFKQWDEEISDKEFEHRFAIAASNLQDNSDGDAIAWAYKYTLPRQEHRKLLIVLSDGSPAGREWAGDTRWYTKKVIKDIEEGKQMEIFGVGIKDANVRLFYKNHAIIHTLSELPEKLLSIIDRATV